MDIVVLREKLHEYINTADERHLSAIYVLVEHNIPPGDEIYDKAFMDMLNQRIENHRNGTSKSYTVEESMTMIRELAKQRLK